MKTIILFGLVLGALSAAGEVFFTEVGQKAILECGVKSFTSRVQWAYERLIWRVEAKTGFFSKGNSVITPRAKKISSTSLEISNIQTTDAGKFTCVVDGRNFEHYLTVVGVSVVPSGALQVGTSASLDCKVNSAGKHDKVEWQSPEGTAEISNKVDIGHVMLSHNGIWRCKVTQQGKSFMKNVTIDVIKAPEPTIPASKENHNSPNSENGQNETGGVKNQPGEMLLLLGLIWWIWVAIGAGVLVIIILVVVIIVVYKRNKRRRRKFLRMKKMQLSQKPKKYCQCVRQTAVAKPQQGRRREKPSALPLQPLLQE